MMDYREFVDQVTKDLGAKLPEELQGARITARQVDKLQGESYYGINVQPEQSPIGVSMDLKSSYERMQDGVSYETALADIADVVQSGIGQRPNVRVNELSDYEVMKEKLMIQVVPTAGNEAMLAGVPHTEREDMSVVYRFVFNHSGHGMTSTLVTNSMLDTYGITAEQLHADAMANAPEHFPADVRSMQEVMADIMGIEPEMVPPTPQDMYVATCNQAVNGAGCMFYPEFMDQAAEKLGGDFFILPSSIHEVILLPDDGQMTAKELESMVQEINQAEVAPEDRLSDSVYHYDAQERVFEKAGHFEERRAEKENQKGEKDRPKEKGSVMKKLDAKKKESHALDGGKKSPHKAQAQEL